MNLNPIDFNYIDGQNTYPILDYITENITCNISNNNIYITNNTFSSNVTLNNYQKLNDSFYYSTSNLIIENKNNFGEIRFNTSYNYVNNSNLYGTIIDYTGKLLIYHNYNAFQPTFVAGYYDVEGELIALKADGINTDIQLTALEAGGIALQGEIISLTEALNLLEGRMNGIMDNIDITSNFDRLRELNNALRYGDATQQYADIVLNLQNNSTLIYNKAFVKGLGYTIGIASAGAAIAAASSYFFYQYASNALYNNSNLTSNEKYQIYNSNTNISNEILTYSNFSFATCNLAIFQGFLNSNIITQQYLNLINTNEIKIGNTQISNIFVSSNVTQQQLIQKIRTNEITLNNKAISRFSLDNIDDFIKTTYGIYYDLSLNGQFCINSTPTNTIDYFRVGGQSTFQGDVICETKFLNSKTTVGAPTLNLGGAGDRIIIYPGTASVYPYSIGLNTNELWISTPNNSTQKTYINNINITTISGTGLSVLSNISTGKLLTTNTLNYAPISLGASGGTGDKLVLYPGSASVYPYSIGINASELWYSSPLASTHKTYIGGTNITSISSTGLSVTGTISSSTGASFSGNMNMNNNQITGISTLVTSTAQISSKLQMTNTNEGDPSLGVTGGTGDKIIIKNGTAFIHPMSIGYNATNLWHSVPIGYSHDFFVNGNKISSILDYGLSFNNFTGNKIISFYEGATPNNINQFRGIGGFEGLSFNVASSSDSFKFYSGQSSSVSTELMRIGGNGNVSINSTNTSLYKLNVNGSGNFTDTVYLSSPASYALNILNNSSGARNAIYLNNNIANFGIIGFGGSAFGGNFQDNMYLQSSKSIILNSLGYSSTSVPRVMINSNGNVGINITNPRNNLHISGGRLYGSNSVTPLKVSAGAISGDTGQGLCIIGLGNEDNQFSKVGIAHLRTSSFDVGDLLFLINTNNLNDTSVSLSDERMRLQASGNTTNLKFAAQNLKINCLDDYNFIEFLGNNTCTFQESGKFIFQTSLSKYIRMVIDTNGNVGVGTSLPSNILQVGNGGRLRIANNFNDYSLIGTLDSDTNQNTRIVLSAYVRSGYEGNIGYYASSIGTHSFFTTNSDTLRLRINNNGDIITSPNTYIYAGGEAANGGLRISGTDPYNTIYQPLTNVMSGGVSVAANIGFTLRDYNSFKFTAFSTAGVYTDLLLINMTKITVNKESHFYNANIYTWDNTVGTWYNSVQIGTCGVYLPTSIYPIRICDWLIYQGTAGGSITNSLIFFHTATGISSRWWFNGQQTSTSAEISDERVKTDIKPISDGLNKVLSLKPKEFNILNDKEKKFQYGFISQDIEKEIPEIIYNENHYIANIYEYGNHNDKIITMKKNINGLINIGDELKILLDNEDKNEYLLNASYDYNKYKKRYVKVVNIIDDYSFEVDIPIIQVDSRPSDTGGAIWVPAIMADEIFVYGKHTTDFKTLEYNSITSLNTSAIQELYKIIQKQQEQINILLSQMIK